MNQRKGDNAAQFKIAMANTPGKRLTYRELALKDVVHCDKLT